MKLVTCYSESHKKLLNIFLSSCIGEYEVKVHEIPQRGSGIYESPGFKESMIDKMKIIKSEATEDFVFSDIDVVFLRPSLQCILKELNSFDCLFQDSGIYCSGLFAMKVNEKTIKFLDDWINTLETGGFPQEEYALRHLIPNSGLAHGKLSHLFTNPFILRGRHWDGTELSIPNETLVFHANWTAGIENKEKLMNMAIQSVKTTI